MTARILDGKAAAAAVKDDLRQRVKALGERGVLPGLGTVLVGDDPGSRAYVEGKPALEVSGDLRVLGYNSPMVEAEKRFWEIQLPVAPRERK